MARTFLTALDLRGNELRNARVQNLGGAPANPAPGQLYYNSALNEFFWFDGTEWVSAKAAGPAGGDLTGAYPNPTIKSGAITNDKVAANAGIAVSKLSGLSEAVISHRLDQLAAPTAEVNLDGNRLVGLADGDLDTDAVNIRQLNQSWESLQTSMASYDQGVRGDFAAADDVVRAEFAAADTAVRNSFAAADAQLRTDFAAADNALATAVQAQFQAAQDAAVADHASIRADFATADSALRADFSAADAAVRDEFAAADDDVRAEFAAADAQVSAAYTQADTALRADFNAADAAIRADFASADTALDASLRTYVDNANASLTAAQEDALADVRSDFEAADTALDTSLRAYIDSRTGSVEGETADEFTAVRAEFAAADTSIRTDYAAADTALGTAVRGEFAAADTALRDSLRTEFAAADTQVQDTVLGAVDQEAADRAAGDAAVRADFAAADTALRQDLTDASGALDTTLRGLISAGDSALRTELEAGDTAARAFATDRANHTGTQPVSTLSDFPAAVRAVPLDEMAVPADDLTVEGYRITNVGAPVDAMDAANKGYVDAMNQGLDVKASVRAASINNVVRSGEQTVDGVELLAGDRVLLKNQSDPSQNGIYTVSAGNWQRAADANDAGEVTPGMFTFVEEGVRNADSGWVLVTDGAISLGATALNFSQFSGAGQVEAGAGLTKDGNTLNIGGVEGRIQVNADTVDIDPDYVGQGTITTVGTLTEGALGEGFTTVGLAQGGTGATTAAGARSSLGATTKAAWTLTNSATEYNLVHGFGSRDVVVQIHENVAPFQVVDADVEITDLNSVTVRMGVAPEPNAYRVVVVG